MAPDETFWVERFAMFTDKFGTPWMLNFEGNRGAARTSPTSIKETRSCFDLFLSLQYSIGTNTPSSAT
jgi:hypothetical protein